MVSVGLPPGQPEKPTITLTPSRSANSTVRRNDSASRSAVFGSGDTGLPWQLNVATWMLRSSNFFFQARALAGSSSNSFTGQ